MTGAGGTGAATRVRPHRRRGRVILAVLALMSTALLGCLSGYVSDPAPLSAGAASSALSSSAVPHTESATVDTDGTGGCNDVVPHVDAAATVSSPAATLTEQATAETPGARAVAMAALCTAPTPAPHRSLSVLRI